MRTANLALPLTLLAFACASPALALDGTTSADHRTPLEAFRSARAALKVGDTATAVVSLQYAAEQGHAAAQWQLGRMYAEGEGVPRNEWRAFEYFRRIADRHAEDPLGTLEARFAADAFVALGQYYLEGIPQTAIKRDPVRAREMFGYAASYFRDADAQYNLGRLYLEGVGAPKDPKIAARWFRLSAKKGQARAQAMLGGMLFSGKDVPRQAGYGLMWLTLAKGGAAPADQVWIAEQYDSAMAQATEDERALAGVYLQQYLNRRDRE
jgi:TPR repeat protein